MNRDGSAAQCDARDVVRAYHERTKHHRHRYAASLGFLDWATQPDPFRRYAGAPLALLPLPTPGRSLPYWQLFVRGSVEPAPLTVDSVSLFFRYGLSLTAWKRLRGATWSLRANPSSGNLHPTEGYAILPALEGIGARPGVHHYAPLEHALELRADLDQSAWAALVAGLPAGSFLIGLSSIHWREAWKYGERAFRYCQHDAGHALGAMRIAAATLGWRLLLLGAAGDSAASALLGLDRDADYAHAEREHPDLLAAVVPAPLAPGALPDLPRDALRAARAASWHGEANALSPEHGVDWPVIDEVARAAWREPGACAAGDGDLSRFPSEGELFVPPVRSGALTAERAIFGRRSAVSMDGVTSIAADVFFRMLGRLVPTGDGCSMPWDAVPWTPRVHLGVFVHRVRDLPAGLYALARDPAKVEMLRAAMGRDFAWRRPAGCPPELHLYLLEERDCRMLAADVSCGQDIAGDGAFSLGMIAEYSASIAAGGAAFYRNLFWECGVVGQVLYLEAEEAGIRATGIGCYFDDPVHQIFGLSPDWQSLYHFTVGGPVEDARLTTLPAYPGLARGR